MSTGVSPGSFESSTELGGRYELVMELASGGMGTVYVGRQRGAAGFERLVAIKRMHQHMTDSPQQVAAFLDEARLASSIRHPNVVGVHDVHPFGSEIVLVMDYVDGVSLSRVFKKLCQLDSALTLPLALRIIVDALHGLHAAHEQRDVMGQPLEIVHRDATPHNILIGEDGSVRITDFGIAKASERSTQTQTGMAKGKVAYMAPEQLRLEPLDRRSDVFAMGLTALELLSGQRAFSGSTDVQTMMAIAAGQVPRLCARRPDLPPQVDAILARATAREREQRFATALDFADALEALGPGASRKELGVKIRELFGQELDARRTRIRAVLSGHAVPTLRSKLSDSLPPSATVGGVVPAHSVPPSSGRSWLLPSLAGASVAVAFVLAGVLWAWSHRSASADSAAATAWAVPSPAVDRAECPSGMRWVEGGKFFLGSAEPQASDNEKPVSQVSMSSFCIDATEVSVAAYRKCSDAGECLRATRAVDWPGITDAERAAYVGACNGARSELSEHPVNCVDYYMAERYCSHVGRRLPSEAEWEYATRGSDGRLYPWGDTLPTPARVNACGGECADWAKQAGVELLAPSDRRDSHPATAPVSSYAPGRSPHGAYNLTGNVWEWTSTWFARYTAAPKANPQGSKSGERKVIRGGGWNSGEPAWLRASFRYPQVPKARHPAIGFRCAASP